EAMTRRREAAGGERAGRGGPRGAPPHGRRPRKAAGGPLRYLWLACLWSFVAGIAALGYFALTLPDTHELTTATRKPSITVLATDGSLIATYGDLFGEPLRLKDLPRYVPEAVIATEDRRFYSHFGIDPVGLLRAAVADLRAGHVVEGGSTITQQLAKNLFLSPDRTIQRKIQETLLALWLEHKFTKDQILEIYLNRVYLGAGTYGIDAAAHRYFDKSARNLTLYEAAVIAGLLKAPSRFSPVNDKDLAARRAAQVLANMVDAGFITTAQAQTAERQQAQLAKTATVHRGSRYFADWVADQVMSFAGTEGHDLVVTTTLDPSMQAEAEQAIGKTLDEEGDTHDVSPGAAPARLVLQADRLFGRARARHAAGRSLQRCAHPHRQLGAAQLRQQIPRRRDRGRRARALDQHGGGPRVGARRHRQCDRHRTQARHHDRTDA